VLVQQCSSMMSASTSESEGNGKGATNDLVCQIKAEFHVPAERIIFRTRGRSIPQLISRER
jgi:hypothetical protein